MCGSSALETLRYNNWYFVSIIFIIIINTFFATHRAWKDDK
jgi:hypothetical protein